MSDNILNGPDVAASPLHQARFYYDCGVALRQNERFGEAINSFRRAADIAGAYQGAGEDDSAELQTIRDAALASIGLIQEIIGFANTDLMNP